MIPAGGPSSSPVTTPFLNKAPRPSEFLVDYPHDPLTGVDHELTYYNGAILLDGSAVMSRPGVVYLSGAFDLNQSLILSFTDGSGSWVWYPDSSAGGYAFLSLGAVRSPRVALDEYRAIASGDADVILGYVRGPELLYRQQRDRFTIEYPYATGATGPLIAMGPARGLRFQFRLLR